MAYEFPWHSWTSLIKQKAAAEDRGPSAGQMGTAFGDIVANLIQGKRIQQQTEQLSKTLPDQLKPFAGYIAKNPSLLRQLYPAATRQGKSPGVTIEQNPDGTWAVSTEPNQPTTGTPPGVPQPPQAPQGPQMSPIMPPQPPPMMTPASGQSPMSPPPPPPPGGPQAPNQNVQNMNNQPRMRLSGVSPNTAAGIISRQKKDPNNIDWASASPQDKELGKGLYEGRIQTSALSWRDRSVGTKLAISYALSNGLPPYVSYLSDTRAKGANYFATGKGGQNAVSLDTALKHMGTLHDAYQKLGNLNERFMNVPINKIGSMTKDPKIVSTVAALTAVQNEVATAFKGTGATDQEISQWRTVFDPSLTPTQQMGLMNTVDELLRGRLSALQNTQQNVMNQSISQRKFLSPQSEAVSKKIRSEGAAQKQGGVPDGTSKNIGGKTYIKQGGQWLEQ